MAAKSEVFLELRAACLVVVAETGFSLVLA
jgi:hypothetical protein